MLKSALFSIVFITLETPVKYFGISSTNTKRVLSLFFNLLFYVLYKLTKKI